MIDFFKKKNKTRKNLNYGKHYVFPRIYDCYLQNYFNTSSKFDYPENIKSALARFQEREYYLNNNLNLSHVCDILFLFLHRSDENERQGSDLFPIQLHGVY